MKISEVRRTRLIALLATLILAAVLAAGIDGPGPAAAAATPTTTATTAAISTMTTATTTTTTTATSTSTSTSPSSSAPPPPNDARDNAQAVGALPASLGGTTVGSTLEQSEPGSTCGRLAGSVWYSVSFDATAPATVGVSLSAGGQLDACVDVFIKQRSEDIPQTGAETDQRGLARLTFSPQTRTTYLIRVGQLKNSDPGSFKLKLFSVTPSASAPGTRLPAQGAQGTLDSFFTTTAAYSEELTAATTYKLNLVSPAGDCMSLAVFAPGTTDFASASPLLFSCDGYRLFTPTQTGRYSFLIKAARGVDVEQPYALHVEPASSEEMAPGVPLDNLSRVYGRLRGNVDSVVALYRLNVTSHSQLTLALDAQRSSSFDLELLNAKGREIDCACDNSGDETLQTITRPGMYYAAVEAENFSSGRFSLSRQSRAITALHVDINGRGASRAPAKSPFRVSAAIGPAVGGQVTFIVEYFDPLSGWQFRGSFTEPLKDGVAAFTFTPPEPGRWRTTASFAGTRSAAPATSGYAQVNEAPPPAD
jgi:hypothetical protein